MTRYITTTSYGTWNNQVAPYSLTVAQSVLEAFGSGEGVEDFDLAAIEADYREAINNALPPHVTLTGDEFIGPAYDRDIDWTGYPVQEVPAGLEDEADAPLDIKAIVDGVDFWAIAEKHDRTA